MLIARTYKIKL